MTYGRTTRVHPPATRTRRTLRTRITDLCLAVLGRYGVCAVGEFPKVVVAEQDGVHGPQAQEQAKGKVADLTLRVRVGPHLDDVPQGPHVPREDHRSFGLVREQRACGLLHLLSRVGPVVCSEHARTTLLALEQEFGHRLVLGRCPVGPLLEVYVKIWVF